MLREYVDQYFQMRPYEDSPYMLLVAPVKEEIRVGEEYGVDFERFHYKTAVNQIGDSDALNAFKHFLLSEILLSNQRRLLMWLFHSRFGKWYTLQS